MHSKYKYKEVVNKIERHLVMFSEMNHHEQLSFIGHAGTCDQLEAVRDTLN
jgi:hypothetical protein